MAAQTFQEFCSSCNVPIQVKVSEIKPFVYSFLVKWLLSKFGGFIMFQLFPISGKFSWVSPTYSILIFSVWLKRRIHLASCFSHSEHYYNHIRGTLDRQGMKVTVTVWNIKLPMVTLLLWNVFHYQQSFKTKIRWIHVF